MTIYTEFAFILNYHQSNSKIKHSNKPQQMQNPKYLDREVMRKRPNNRVMNRTTFPIIAFSGFKENTAKANSALNEVVFFNIR